jgi:hypothetical protein
MFTEQGSFLWCVVTDGDNMRFGGHTVITNECVSDFAAAAYNRFPSMRDEVSLCLQAPPQRPGRKSTGAAGKKGSGKQLQLSLEMAQGLLAAYDAVPQQQQQQGADGAGSSMAAAAAADASGEAALLPKEAFVLQLVRECCGTAKQPKAEKVVVFSQVGQSPRWGGGR